MITFWHRVDNQYEYSDKTPYLGYYNDLDKNCIGWQIKWMAENGIDFISPFFYSV